jgi:DSF synthase
VAPVTLDELNRITEVWVDTALKLSEKQLKVMDRLARAQLRRPKTVLEQVTAV